MKMNGAPVPTWAEIRQDASRLSKAQRNLYVNVHELLDSIPLLDQKISSYNGYTTQVTKPKLTTIHVRTKAPQAQISHHKPINTQAQKKEQKKPKHRQQIVNKPTDNHLSPSKPSLTLNDEDEDYQTLDQFEHLRPPPLPLSEYFKRNRPDLIRNAESRAMYLRKKAERRKYIASTRIINTLEQIKLSSRCSSAYQSLNSRQSRPPQQAPTTRDNTAPAYQVRCKLSEHEMKRLTARTYKRLPEVKRRRNEEMTNHMKVQNYKNKLEYGRKLLENRRNGIIDYPLQSSYNDRSITSSQSDFSMNGYGRAADAFKADPYF